LVPSSGFLSHSSEDDKPEKPNEEDNNGLKE
jgi:hypothetical protein